MKVFVLLSWFDEREDHLRRCVRSLEGFADVLVAVDGAYATFPGARGGSPVSQGFALQDAARDSSMGYSLTTAHKPWASEVAKRAALFEYGRDAGATPDDWFLIVDADMTLAEFTPEARELLAATDRDVAEVRWHDMQINGVANSTHRFRSMFRALPGLTVERTHFLYTVPDDCGECGGEGSCLDLAPCTTFCRDCACNGPRVDSPCRECSGTGRRFLWHTPDGRISNEPALDLFGHVTLHHFNSQRDQVRKQRALAYYQDRDARTLETAGDWR